jgi:hypothetical protein
MATMKKTDWKAIARLVEERNEVISRMRTAVEHYAITPGELFPEGRMPVETARHKPAKKLTVAKAPAKRSKRRTRRTFTDAEKQTYADEVRNRLRNKEAWATITAEMDIQEGSLRRWMEQFPAQRKAA